MYFFQNPASGYSRGGLDSAQATPQAVGSPPQRIRRAPELQVQARYCLPSHDGKPAPYLAAQLIILIKMLYSSAAAYR